VLAGFAIGSLWGYKGGAIIVEGNGFANNLTQYDDFVPGKFTQEQDLEAFSFDVDKFDITWLYDGPRRGMAQKFVAHVRWRESPDDGPKEYALRVNHPLSIGDTDVFLIGHGYAPVITVRDAEGNVAYSGPSIFLPQDPGTFTSFGVVKVPDAKPRQLGLEGLLLPTYDGDPLNSSFGQDLAPLLTLEAYAGDLGLDSGEGQSVYRLDKDRMQKLTKKDGSMFRVDLCPADRQGCNKSTVRLPDGNGTVTFESVQPWVRVQVSRTPGTWLALTGVILALLGLLGSLFIRPRRVWVRARRREDGVTLVELAALDRSSGGDVSTALDEIVAGLKTAAGGGVPEEKQ